MDNCRLGLFRFCRCVENVFGLRWVDGSRCVRFGSTVRSEMGTSCCVLFPRLRCAVSRVVALFSLSVGDGEYHCGGDGADGFGDLDDADDDAAVDNDHDEDDVDCDDDVDDDVDGDEDGVDGDHFDVRWRVRYISRLGSSRGKVVLILLRLHS